jgi:hypothetical protein
MKAKLFLLLALFSTLPLFSARSQTVLTFDDLSESGSGTYLPNGYHGLGWNNCGVFNAILWTNVLANRPGGPTNGLSGDFYGMVSASNVVGNGNGAPAGIDSYTAGTNFNFFSVYLTGAWNSNLNIEVQGYRETNLVYDETKVVAATYPTLCTFDYLDIDHLVFSSSGGEPAFGPTAFGSGQYYFDMDNFIFEFIPEPSSLLLTILGVLMLWGFRKRRAK